MLQLADSGNFEMAVQAAALYQELRKAGVTIRKPNDCLIACYAIHNGIPMLQTTGTLNT